MRLLRLAERALSDAESAAHAPTMGYRRLTQPDAAAIEARMQVPLTKTRHGPIGESPQVSCYAAARSPEVGFVADSPLEEAVRSEPVSEMGFPK